MLWRQTSKTCASIRASGEGFQERWSEDGYDYEVRIHGPDPKAPSGSNSASGTTYRVARRKQGVDSKGQGSGWENLDQNNNWHKARDLKTGKDPKAANDTHIPIPKK